MEFEKIIYMINSGDVKQQFAALDNLFNSRLKGMADKKQVLIQLLSKETHPGVRYKARKILNKIDKLLIQNSTFIQDDNKEESKNLDLEFSDISREHHKNIESIKKVPEKLLTFSKSDKMFILKRINLSILKVPVRVLLDLLNLEKDNFIIATILKSIGIMGNSEQIIVIAPFLKDKDPRIRANSIEALCHIEDDIVYTHIVPLLRDLDNRVRGNAVKALKDIGSQNVFSCLDEMIKSGKEHYIQSAIYALNMISENDNNREIRLKLFRDAEQKLINLQQADLSFDLSDGDPIIDESGENIETGVLTDLVEFCGSYFMEHCYESLSYYHNLYVTEDIPEKRLISFKRVFEDNIPETERILLLYDHTAFGSGKKGMLLTDQKIYIFTDKEKKSLQYSDLKSVKFDGAGNLIFNGITVLSLNRLETEAKELLLGFLNRIITSDFNIYRIKNEYTDRLLFKKIKVFTRDYFHSFCAGAYRISEHFRFLDDINGPVFQNAIKTYVHGFRENESVIISFDDKSRGKKGFLLTDRYIYFSNGKNTGRFRFESIKSIEFILESGESILIINGKRLLHFLDIRSDIYDYINRYFLRLFKADLEIDNPNQNHVTGFDDLIGFTRNYFVSFGHGLNSIENTVYFGENISSKMMTWMMQEHSSLDLDAEKLLFVLTAGEKYKSQGIMLITSRNLYYSNTERKGSLSLSNIRGMNSSSDLIDQLVIVVNDFEVMRLDSSKKWFVELLCGYFEKIIKSELNITQHSNSNFLKLSKQEKIDFTRDYFNLIAFKSSSTPPDSLQILPEKQNKLRKNSNKFVSCSIPVEEEILLFHEERSFSGGRSYLILTDVHLHYRDNNITGKYPVSSICSLSINNDGKHMILSINSEKIATLSRYGNDFDKVIQTYFNKLIKGELITKRENNFKLLTVYPERIQQFSDTYFRIKYFGLQQISRILFIGNNIGTEILKKLKNSFYKSQDLKEELLLTIINDEQCSTGFVLTSSNLYYSSGDNRSRIPIQELSCIDLHVSDGRNIVMVINEYCFISLKNIYREELEMIQDYFNRILDANFDIDDTNVEVNKQIDKLNFEKISDFCEENFTGICFKRLCYGKYVINEKIQNLKIDYAPNLDTSKIILFYDDSLDFSGNPGFVLTDKDFYYSFHKHDKVYKGCMSLSEIKKISFNKDIKDFSSEILINNFPAGFLKNSELDELILMELLFEKFLTGSLKMEDHEMKTIDDLQKSIIDEKIMSKIDPLLDLKEKFIFTVAGLNTIYSHDNVLCTDSRLYIVGKNLFGFKEHTEHYQYEKITHISIKSGVKGKNASLTEKIIEDGINVICSLCGICDIQFIFEGKEFVISNIRKNDALQIIKVVKIMHMSHMMNHESSTPESMDIVKKMKDLKILLDEGIITESDYKESKNRILENLI
ncbi:HEAT repeat domain-containing protein [bacterium]|nr:HEAT repeat domain-containing protein [bacterium]